MTPKSIAFVTPMHFDPKSYMGGGERYPLNLARGIIEASNGRCSVDMISYGEQAAERELSPGLTLRVLPLANRSPNPLDALSWELPGALAGADLVHLHQIFTRSNEIALVVAKLAGKALCVTDHGGGNSSIGSSFEFLGLANRVICYSKFASSFIRTSTPIEIIPGGVDTSFFTPPEGRPKRDRVIYVGRLLPHKGIDRLISALPPGLPLTVCGAPYDPNYFRFLKALSIGKQVEFLTDATDTAIRDLYRRSWAVVLPSVYRDCYGRVYLAPELMGLTLLEAMACGTPAISSRVGATPEFIEHGETGFVYDHLTELAEYLKMLAADRSMADEMGEKGRATVERELSHVVVGGKLLSVYEAIMAEAGVAQ